MNALKHLDGFGIVDGETNLRAASTLCTTVRIIKYLFFTIAVLY
jgi:hypothetical protein